MKTVLALTAEQRLYSYKYREVVELLPAHLKTLLLKDRDSTEDDARRLFNWIMQQGRRHLDATTILVFQFIFWRTYTFYKRAELISKRQFLQGVWDGRTSESRCAPATTSEHTLYKALNTLEQLGFVDWYAVSINGADVTSLFEINIKTVLDHELKEQDMGKLRIGKKRTAEILDFPAEKESIVGFRGRCKVAPPPVVQGCTTEYNNNKKVTKSDSCSVPRNATRVSRIRKVEIDCNTGFDKASDAIASAVARVTEKREIKAARATRTAFPSLQSLNALWQLVMVAEFGSCTVSGMTHKEYGMFKRIAKPHQLSCSWKEFFTWVVSSWTTINLEGKEIAAFKKKKGDWSLQDENRIFLGAETPDLYMMIRNFPKLVKRYSQHALSGKGTVRESAEIIELKKAVKKAEKQNATIADMLNRAMRVQGSGDAIRKERKQVKIVDPEKDTFFDEVDSSLPEWK